MISQLKRFIKSFCLLEFLDTGFHIFEHKLKDKYYSENNELIPLKETQIVFMVDGRHTHGGLTDRLRAITTIYHYCKLKGIRFYIHFVYPFDLSLFLEPNIYDWSIKPKEISYNSKQATPAIIFDWHFNAIFHKPYLNKIVSKNKGKQIHIYSNSNFYKKYYSQDFNELFKLSPILTNRIKLEQEYTKAPYVAMVFRFQQLLGDFKEANYKILPEEEKQILIENCINKVKEIHDKYSYKTILVTSDSISFLKYISNELPYVHIISGRMVHMDYTKEEDKDVYMKSFIDMIMLSKAEKIYLLKTGDMYHSGFAKYAAMLNNKPYEEILF